MKSRAQLALHRLTHLQLRVLRIGEHKFVGANNWQWRTGGGGGGPLSATRGVQQTAAIAMLDAARYAFDSMCAFVANHPEDTVALRELHTTVGVWLRNLRRRRRAPGGRAGMNGYAPPIADEKLPVLLTSRDIDRLFRRLPGWFERDRVRKRLYAKGFPHPVQAGLWSPIAIHAWMTGVGSNPDNVPPNVKPARHGRHKKGRAVSGYAPT
ncbi:hypothetical protein [Reyranella sp.]|uniref:hypothetical protein n=1 Tax=Reyranella sp. TaxID=1929291 RepID=UPI0027184BFF|nr:hypothetical protein [Reyranella sp.]MDO8976747.1 hypothetical protein [Reyranella sp.]